MKTIYLSGGCFWGVQHYLRQIRGVVATEVGFANGTTCRTTYREVCHNNTGHSETVRTVYDPELLPLPKLLSIFFVAIDPTSLNRQGGDEGTQYRTGIYVESEEDLEVAKRCVERLQLSYSEPVVVEVKMLSNYCDADDDHQLYLEKNPSGYCHLSPELFLYARRANCDDEQAGR